MDINERKFLETYKKKIIKDCIKTIYKQFTVIDKHNNDITDQELHKILLRQKNIKRCIGCTNKTPISQCTKNAIHEFDYCKSHLYKAGLTSEKPIVTDFNIIKQHQLIDKSDLIKKFIDDSFYYIHKIPQTNQPFIYNMNLEKVGYIHNNEYILTSNPFILQMI